MSEQFETIRAAAIQLKSVVGLTASPVGVRLVFQPEPIAEHFVVLHQLRYFQALMKARHGEKVILDAEGIACPASAATFGFRPLPERFYLMQSH